MPVYDVNGIPVCGAEVEHATTTSVNAFLSYMADKCALLEMSGTLFVNPSGLTTDSYSTPQDLLKLGLAASANPKCLEIWSMPNYSFKIKGDNERTISVENNVIDAYAATLSNGGYKFLGGKGGSLTMSGYDRAAILIVGVQDKIAVLSLMARGQTPYNNINKSAKELCDMVNASLNGQTPSAGTNLNALISGGGGYAACIAPDLCGAFVNLESPTELLARSNSVSNAPTAQRVPASTTKTMTMLCAFDFIVDEYEEITIKTADISSGSGSTFYDGDILTFHDAVRIMMMESSNTMANAIARFIGYKILNRGVE